MTRREFIAGLGAAAIWPFVVRAQPSERMRRVGVFAPYDERDPEVRGWLAAFREELQKFGWHEERNLRIEYRWATTDAESLQRAARELLALQPDAILTENTITTAAMLHQTRTIPIIFAQGTDPVGSGLVASLSRPGGNVTGFINLEGSLAGKWLELLKEIAPSVKRVALLFNPASAPFFEYYLGPFKSAAPSFGVEPIPAPFHDAAELEAVVAAQARQPMSGLIAMPDASLTVLHKELTSLAVRFGLPAVYPFRLFTKDGGLLSYGNDRFDNHRRAANYVDRVLRGTKPSELPVQIPSKFELVINLKTAKALGLAIPATLLARADELIE